MDKLTIFKVGGNVIDDEVALKDFLEKFSEVKGYKLLIHGGGKKATEVSKKLGIEVKMHNGRRITDEDTIDVVTMVYAGLVNKKMVALLQAKGNNAIGLSGADANLIPANKRKPNPIDWGFVGDVESNKINTSFLSSLLGMDVTPIFCALTHDGKGSMLNTNADTIASCLAVSLANEYQVRLVYCFEKNGVLYNSEDDNSIIPLINKESYSKLLEDGIIKDGMIPKLDSAFSALDNGVNEVVIKHANNILNQLETVIKL